MEALCNKLGLKQLALTSVIEIGFTYGRDSKWADSAKHIEKYLTSTRSSSAQFLPAVLP